MGQRRREDELAPTEGISGRDLLAQIARVRERRAGHEGIDRASLLLVHRGEVRVVPLREDRPVVIGRSHPADVVFDSPQLSRRHAAVELVGDRARVEDLGSTNGTWLEGERVERAAVEPGMELAIGPVTASLQLLSPLESEHRGLFRHELFALDLDDELQRVQRYERRAALVLLHAEEGRGRGAARWIGAVRARLRPFDRIALYSPDTVEVLLPEVDADEAVAIGRRLVRGEERLRCGIAVAPDHAATADGLFDAARGASRRTSPGSPVVVATARHGTAVDPDGVDGEAPVAESEAMRELLRTARRLGRSVIPVLLQGETGTGKEVVAQAIHAGGPRADKPLIPVNCGAIPGQLVEATLFGHERGAFTGAERATAGVFEAADGGTVLLDEIGELPAAAQAALLRVLEDKRVTRVGSTEQHDVDVRVLASTHRDLRAMVDAGTFRQDLLYRLNAMTVAIPPLRERTDDIAHLAARFLARANRDNGCAVDGFADGVLDALRAHRWPGNVRELRNAVERAAVLAWEGPIVLDDLPTAVREAAGLPHRDGLPGEVRGTPATAGRTPDPLALLEQGTALPAIMEQLEEAILIAALEQTGGHRGHTARLLGIPERTLGYKLDKHGLRKTGWTRSTPR